MTDLLSCPFCGSDQVSLSEGETGDGQPWPYVECEDCAATATPDNWNRRAALSPAELGGVESKVLCHRLHQPNYSSEWISGDYTGPESTQRGWSVERAYSLARCEAVAVKAHGYMQELEAVKAELASKRINRVDAMAWRLLNNQHLRDVLTRAADAEDQSAVGCLRRLDLILSRDTHPAAPEGVSARFFASGPEGEFFTGSHAFAETLLAAAGRDRDEWTITDLQEPRKP